MLFLKHAAEGPAQSSAPAGQLPVDEKLAVHLERALLADDDTSRVSELTAAVAANSDFQSWVLRTAEVSAGRTINRTDEAVQWLSRHLTGELAKAIASESAAPSTSESEWRLPTLVK